MMEKYNKVSYILAISQFSLAAALVYFALEFSRVATQIPEILSSVETTSEKIEPVLIEIGEIRAQIPSVLKEVKEIRKLISPVLDEVKLVREQLPAVLTEVKEVREQIPVLLAEAKAVRIIVPDVLKEVKRTREAIPPMLAQGERMIGAASKAGRRASEGAITGVITGILKAPFNLIGGLGRSMFGASAEKIKGLTEGDENMAARTAVAILAAGKLGESRNWNNSDSGNDGTVTIKEVKLIGGDECRVINNVVRIDGEEKINTDVTACLNDKLEWEMFYR